MITINHPSPRDQQVKIIMGIEFSKDQIDKLICEALAKGIELVDQDKRDIHEAFEKSLELNAQSDRLMGRDSHLDGVKSYFHLGMVGGSGRNIRSLNRRREKALDRTVSNAGKAVELNKQASAWAKKGHELLEGKGTKEDRKRKAVKAEQRRINAGIFINALKKGDEVGGVTVKRVNKDRDGYPISFSYQGDYSWDEKIDLVRLYFGNSRDQLRKYVDLARI